ncbi:hypothetical protein FBU30_008909 [Linnemannia zychae]|nr:hypothetical protein FBU30_008909 [Linnemannia zychae]
MEMCSSLEHMILTSTRSNHAVFGTKKTRAQSMATESIYAPSMYSDRTTGGSFQTFIVPTETDGSVKSDNDDENMVQLSIYANDFRKSEQLGSEDRGISPSLAMSQKGEEMATFYNNKSPSASESPRSRILSSNTMVTINKELVPVPQSKHRMDHHSLDPHDAKDGTQEIQLAHTTLKANQGDKDAQVALGDIYMKGRGSFKQDYNMAMSWYTKAAEQGSSVAQRSISNLYRDGHGVQQNYLKAMTWFEKAAEQGNAEEAQNIFSNLCQHGHGVQQDYSMAMPWYKKAAEQENANAQCNIGILYFNGHGVQQDYSTAMTWFEKAADQGHAAAQHNIGYIYFYGCRVQRDKSIAKMWYQKAAEQGDENAILRLKGLDST